MFLHITRMISSRATQSDCRRQCRALLAVLTLSTLAGGLTSGCGSGGSTVGSERMTVSSTKSIDGLTLTLSEDTASIGVGQSVNYTLTVTNTSSSPVTYVPESGAGIAAAIPGTNSFVTVTKSGASTPAQIPPDFESTTSFIILGSTVTLAPGATLSGTVSTGTEIDQAGVYSTTATVYIAVGNTDNGDPGFDTLLSTGPLVLNVR